MSLVGFPLAIIAAISWGAIYALNQKLLQGIPVTFVMLGHSVISLFVIVPFIVQSRKEGFDVILEISWQTIGVLVAVAFLSLLANYCILSSIKCIGAAQASTIEVSYPIFVIIFSSLFFREQITMSHTLGALLIFSGVYVIFTQRAEPSTLTSQQHAHSELTPSMRDISEFSPPA